MNRFTRWQAWVAGAALGGVVILGSCTDKPGATTVSDLEPSFIIPSGATGYDLNDPTGSPVNINGALWFFPSEYDVGTGLIDPFLSIQAAGTQTGFNTDGDFNYDQTRPQFTDALPLNNVPIIKYQGANFRQVILDANEANSPPAAQFSIDQFDLYVCVDETGDLGPPVAGVIPLIDEPGDFVGQPFCQLIYSFTEGYTGFATDGLTAGSGQRLDYDILIPEAAFDAFAVGDITVDDCPYNPLADECGLWVVLESTMGAFGGDWVTGSTFEEYSTILQPFVQIVKTAVPEFTREYTWEITKAVDPENIYLFDGQSYDADYDVVVTQTGVEDSGWQVSGLVTITNPSDADATITGITDLLQPGNIPITLDCPPLDGDILGGGEDLVCEYTYNFGSDPGETEYTNTVEVELEGLAVTYGESETFSFGEPTTEINKTVDVNDDNVAELLADDITAGDTFEYTLTFTCGEDEGQNTNTAQVIGDGAAVLDEDQATVTVTCLDVEVSKDANTSLERTYKWTIDKSVTPASWDLFDGDDGTSDYTVTVTPDGFDDAQWAVDGTITIHNPNSVSVFIQSVSDVVSPDISASVDCGETFPYELAAGGDLECDYSTTLSDGSDRTNTATVSAKPTSAGESKDFSNDPAVDVSFAGVSLTEVNKTINVDDTYPVDPTDLGSANWDDGATDFEYSRTFSCGDDEGTHDNTATIVETGQSDDASVSVACYDLDVAKDAATTFTRTWEWDIDKVVDPSCFLEGTYDAIDNVATVQENQSLEVCYKATIDADYTDSEFNVTEGANGIVITNNHPTMDADLTGVADVVSPAISAAVSCPSLTVPADGTLTCTYAADLPDALDRTNTATATQQNYSYASDGTPTDNGTTDYDSPGVDVQFDLANPTSEIDECVDVDDAIADALGTEVGTTSFGTYCASDGVPHDFEYSYLFGPGEIPLECDDNMFENTASFITNDTGTEGSDPAEINIFVECVEGCTLTLGYWKTHNETRLAMNDGHGPPPDPTWMLLGDQDEDGTEEYEGEEFFGSGQTWYEVFWTTPKGGNAYYILAHQYMAAYLNLLAGAGAPAEVTQAMADAEALFGAYDPDDPLRGKNGAEVRKQFIDLAGILGSYNEGLIGPGHCTENGYPS